MKDTCIFTFGRLNPPHKGHEQVFEKALQLHKSTKKSSLKVFISKSCYNNKNPLPYDIKVQYIKELFPVIAKKIQHINKGTDLFEIMQMLDGHYENIIFVGGSDRIEEFQKKLDAYNGVLYNFKSISTIMAGEERTDLNYSSTLMRKAVQNDDFQTFYDSVPGDDLVLKEKLYKDVKHYLMENEDDSYTPYVQFKNQYITLG